MKKALALAIIIMLSPLSASAKMISPQAKDEAALGFMMAIKSASFAEEICENMAADKFIEGIGALMLSGKYDIKIKDLMSKEEDAQDAVLEEIHNLGPTKWCIVAWHTYGPDGPGIIKIKK